MNKFKFSIILTVIALVVVLGSVYAVRAFGERQVALQSVENAEVVNQYCTDSSAPSDVGGAVAAVSGICTGSEFPTQLCNVNAYELQIQTDLTIDDNLTVSDEITYGGVTGDWITGSCTNGTTTLISIINPFSADVTIDIFEIDIVNGTSTASYQVGTSSDQYADAVGDLSDTLVDGLSIATSTDGTATTTERIIVRNSSSAIAGTAGFTAPGTNSEPFIRWESGDYLSAFVDTVYTGAFTEATNFASCTYKIHSYR